MDRSTLIIALALVTLFIVLGIGLYQRRSVRRSQKRAGIDPDSPEPVPQPGSLDERRRAETR